MVVVLNNIAVTTLNHYCMLHSAIYHCTHLATLFLKTYYRSFKSYIYIYAMVISENSNAYQEVGDSSALGAMHFSSDLFIHVT